MLYIAIPILNERENLPKLLADIKAQDYPDFKVLFCVNQPDSWWEDEVKLAQCEDNRASMDFLREHVDFPFEIIDKSSKGKGWQGKQIGVGWARKLLMDRVLEIAAPDDIIISLDADTHFKPAYFSSIVARMKAFPKAPAISVPYYHPLSGWEAEDRAILRYELYMRSYLINLFRINSPFAFTALGSAIAMRVWALRTIGGMTPKKSGEDFYLLQKLIKYKPVLQWNEEPVYPATRFSDRVFFGTGPAMIKGNSGDWSSYPIYPKELFNEIAAFYDLIPELFRRNLPTPVDAVFPDISREWDKLRKNNKKPELFARAVHHKFDGLRILQFLKQHPRLTAFDDSGSLIALLQQTDLVAGDFSLDTADIQQLDAIRDYLCKVENQYRRQADERYGR